MAIFKKPEFDSWEDTVVPESDLDINDSAIRIKVDASKNQDKRELIKQG